MGIQEVNPIRICYKARACDELFDFPPFIVVRPVFHDFGGEIVRRSDTSPGQFNRTETIRQTLVNIRP